MKFQEGFYFHLFNRGNTEKDILFRHHENYLYFLKKYREYLDEYFDTICYCLLPNHFHFLVKVKDANLQNFTNRGDLDYSHKIIQQISNFLNCYAKSYNKKFNRRGSLFQKRTKSKIVDSVVYFQRLVRYIHRNPIKHNYVDMLESWEYSSYLDYIGFRNGTLPKKKFVLENFKGIEDFKKFTESKIDIYEDEFKQYLFE